MPDSLVCLAQRGSTDLPVVEPLRLPVTWSGIGATEEPTALAGLLWQSFVQQLIERNDSAGNPLPDLNRLHFPQPLSQFANRLGAWIR